MALISAKTIITSVSLFHITLAFFFITNPSRISEQALVYILGESMGLPEPRGLDVQSAALSLLAIVLAMMGVSDLVSLSMPEELGALYYWGTQAPIRAIFSFAFVFYSWVFGPSSPVYTRTPSPRSSGALHRATMTYTPSGWGGDFLKNRVFFSFMFLEMITWFWAWMTLREERSGVVERLRRREEHTHSHSH